MAGDVTLGDLLRFAPQLDTSFQETTNAATAAIALTGAQVAGSLSSSYIGPDEVVLSMTGALGAGANLTTPTAAQIAAAIPNMKAGMSYRLRIINKSSGAFAWTLVAGTNVTLAGTSQAIAQNTWREYRVLCTGIGGAVAYTFSSVGTGTWS